MLCRSLQVTARLILALWMALAPVKVWAGSMTLLGVGGGAAAPTYQGPGDVVASSGMWGSCARVYQASLANTSTSLCDLVAVTGGAAVCTLRGSSSGFVDLAASYCAGTTPAAACAAASGGSCKVTKVYDQAGATGGCSNATLASMPALTFSAANGLPGLTFTDAASAALSCGALTNASPYTFVAVGSRTANFTNASGYIANNGGGVYNLGPFSSANTVYMANTTAGQNATASDSALHALIGIAVTVGSGGTNTIVVDGSANSGSSTIGALSSTVMRWGRSSSGGHSLDGFIMEIGYWPSALNSTQYGNLNTNIHSSNGYNF